MFHTLSLSSSFSLCFNVHELQLTGILRYHFYLGIAHYGFIFSLSLSFNLTLNSHALMTDSTFNYTFLHFDLKNIRGKFNKLIYKNYIRIFYYASFTKKTNF